MTMTKEHIAFKQKQGPVTMSPLAKAFLALYNKMDESGALKGLSDAAAVRKVEETMVKFAEDARHEQDYFDRRYKRK